MNRNDDIYWQKYAREIIQTAIDTDTYDAPTLTAAVALLADLESHRHPSYFNTQFVIAAHVFPEHICDTPTYQLYAWRILVNGLSGYWQWTTHNDGEFSVVDTLRKFEILTADEAENAGQFNVYRIKAPKEYCTVNYELLKRIVKKFNLPTTNVKLGGSDLLTLSQFKTLEHFKHKCNSVSCSMGDKYRYTLATM